MVYTILISIVFIAELIIAITIIQNLHRIDKSILTINEELNASKTSIKDICELSRKISVQLVIISQDFVNKTKENSEELLLKQLLKSLLGLLLLSSNFKIINKLRKSKIAKTLSKGLSIIELMV